MSKAREWPRGWQMPGPRAVQNLQMPRSSSRGGWAQLNLTDALVGHLFFKCDEMGLS